MSALSHPRLLSRRDHYIAAAVALLYIVVVKWTVDITGRSEVMFPELGAVAYDVMTRPWGKWASQPLRMVLTPLLTAILGTLATQCLPYHVAVILVLVLAALFILWGLKSNMAPAISAGVLPLVLHQTTWGYPVTILATLGGAALLSLAWRRYRRHTPTPPAPEIDLDDVLESAPRGKHWLIVLLAFVAVLGTVAQWTGLRFILFPPLIVIAYEMLGHPDACPWASRPVMFPIACFLAAAGGLQLVHWLGPSWPAAGLAMLWSILLLNVFNIHMPPAMAVALIPLVLQPEGLTWKYPASVGLGTLALTITSVVFRRRIHAREAAEPMALEAMR